MHLSAAQFCMRMRALFPSYFRNKFVVDIGGANINGGNAHLFSGSVIDCVDIWPGPGVDIVCAGKDLVGSWDVAISTECLEHDKDFKATFANMCRMADDMVLMTCAGPKRPEHGTSRTCPEDSPVTNEYYKNLRLLDISPSFWRFKYCHGDYAREYQDLYFIGFKQIPKPQFRGAMARYISYEFRLFFLQRCQRWRRFFKNIIKLAKICP